MVDIFELDIFCEPISAILGTPPIWGHLGPSLKNIKGLDKNSSQGSRREGRAKLILAFILNKDRTLTSWARSLDLMKIRTTASGCLRALGLPNPNLMTSAKLTMHPSFTSSSLRVRSYLQRGCKMRARKRAGV